MNAVMTGFWQADRLHFFGLCAAILLHGFFHPLRRLCSIRMAKAHSVDHDGVAVVDHYHFPE